MSQPNPRELAIAQAVARLNPGDTLEVHASDCPLSTIEHPTEADEAACACTPLVMTVTGARA